MITDVIIPALNEELSIEKVINSIPSQMVRNIIVVDNGSTDNTCIKAQSAGALVLHESERGYGAACLKGISYLDSIELKPEVVVFIDGDYSDFPEEMGILLDKISINNVQLVLGSRVLGNSEKGSLSIHQQFGNKLAVYLLKKLYQYSYTDLGPFRAITYSALKDLGMCDRNYGWTVEMQLKAAKKKLKFSEVPVSYRNRIGKSKVSGTIKGSMMAGYKILVTIVKHL